MAKKRTDLEQLRALYSQNRHTNLANQSIPASVASRYATTGRKFQFPKQTRLQELRDKFGSNDNFNPLSGGGASTPSSEGLYEGGSMKANAKNMAENYLASAYFHNDTEFDERDGKKTPNDSNEYGRTRAQEEKYTIQYLKMARNNGASLKKAKGWGNFSNAQLKAAGYTIG